MFKNIMLATTLFAMNMVDAKQIGGAKAQPTRVISTTNQEQMLLAQQEEALKVERLKQELSEKKAAQERAAQEKGMSVGAPSQTSKIVDLEDWDDMENKFYDALESGNLRTANRIIRRMDDVTNATSQQKTSLRRIKQILKQQAMIQAQTTAKKESNPLKGLLGGWWSGETANVENYKNMILAKLDNVEKYPTLKSKQDALELGIEFFDGVYNDENIMQKAIIIVMRVLPGIGDTSEQHKTINALNDKMRKYCGVDLTKFDLLSIEEKIAYLQKYLENNKARMKAFIAKEMTDENVVAFLQAIISERERINTMITSLNSLKSAQEKPQELAQEANAEQVPMRAPQGRPAGGQ
jgi:hypothetical protein